MVRTITMKFSGFCAECSAPLPKGTRARWSGRGRVFGLTCHAPKPVNAVSQFTNKNWNDWSNGRAVRSNGMCEDAPCCGCCGDNQLGFTNLIVGV